jgi:hypothetical protein
MGLVAHMGEVRYMHKVLVWKTERKRHFRIPGYGWENTIVTCCLVTWLITCGMLVWHWVLFGLSLAKQQLFTLQISYTQRRHLSSCSRLEFLTGAELFWNLWQIELELTVASLLQLQGELNIDHHLEQFIWYCVYSLPWICMLILWRAIV